MTKLVQKIYGEDGRILPMYRTYTFSVLSGFQKTGFVADVCDEQRQVVYRIPSAKALGQLLEAGYMSHSNDVVGLQHYLRKISVIGKNDYLTKGR